MSCTQFSKAITLLKRVCDLIKEVCANSSTPQYNSSLIDLYNASQALFGVRPTNMSEVRTSLETMSREFYNFAQNASVIRRMGSIDYLLPNEGNLSDDFRHPFIYTYLSDSRTSMSGASISEAARILDRCPFFQSELSSSNSLERLLMRNPDLTQSVDGFVHVRPSYLFRFPAGSQSVIGNIQGNDYPDQSNVYASDDSLYIVIRRIEPFTANLTVNAVLTSIAEHVYFFGTVEICTHVDERAVGMVAQTTILQSNVANLPTFRLKQGTAPHAIGSKFEYGIKLESTIDIIFPNGIQYPAEVRGVIIRFKGRFYVNRCGYTALQKSTNLVALQNDSWNHEFDSLRIGVLTSSSTCSNDVMTTITNSYALCLNTALQRITTNPQRLNLIVDDFSDLSRTLATIMSYTDLAMGININQRQRLCTLATNLHIIYCTFMAWYTPV